MANCFVFIKPTWEKVQSFRYGPNDHIKNHSLRKLVTFSDYVTLHSVFDRVSTLLSRNNSSYATVANDITLMKTIVHQ